MQVFLDRKNVVDNATIGLAKDHLHYLAFKSAVYLDIDSLAIKSSLVGMEDFATFLITDLKNVEHNFSDFDNQDQLLSLSHGPNTEMVLALNRKTGQTYRIFGFNGNDIGNFLNDFFGHYELKFGERLRARKFFRAFRVENVDFKCLYKGTRRIRYSPERFPCLKKASEPFRIE
jgi:hypothetical protein